MGTDSPHESDFEATLSGANIEELRELAQIQKKILMQREAAFYIAGMFGLPSSEASLAAFDRARAKLFMLETAVAERTKEARSPRRRKMTRSSTAGGSTSREHEC